MRDYSKFPSGCWRDFDGQIWPVIKSRRRLKFKYPAHAALRRHVFVCDRFQCRRCSAKAAVIPVGYDGRDALWTDTWIRSGGRDLLILDHMLTLSAGGRSVIENLQTLCETCNRKKMSEDITAIRNYRSGLAP